MNKNKLLKEMEERLSALEKEFNYVLSSIKEEEKNKLSYEEVIDLWLNGKNH
ncbi:MAG: hypothetical protein J6D23_02415 [Clostridia bacterium]|nr:hypothetical protein [Clostridia bacterium]